jgi:membrane-associated phospholipid phosphatase
MVQAKRLALATDLLTAAYGAVLLGFVLLFRHRIAHFQAHAAFDAAMIAAVSIFHSLRQRGGLLGALSLLYPILLYTPYYVQTGLLNRTLLPTFLDPWFLRADELLFGEFPGFYLNRLWAGRLADEFFHFFYLTYYFAIPTVAVLLYLRKPPLLPAFVCQVSALFYACYLTYVLLPVEGPLRLRAVFFRGPGFTRSVVDFLFAAAEKPGAAFPSSHVAVALVVAWWGAEAFPRLRWPFAVQASLLSVATVYCAFHYAVDVIAGALLGAAAVWLWKTLAAGSTEPMLPQ